MPVFTRGRQDTTDSPARYRITVAREHPICITATDCRTGARICGWRGEVAAQLLDCGLLPPARGTVASCEADKAFVQDLALAAASAQMALDSAAPAPATAARRREAPTDTPMSLTGERWSRLEARLRRLDTTLVGPLRLVARLLFSHPGQHFSPADVCCLLAMRGLPVSSRDVGTWLDELAARCITQRIDVGSDRVFYDTDTRPHVHIYDQETEELHDATVQGVIRSGSSTLPASLEIAGNNRVHIVPV